METYKIVRVYKNSERQTVIKRGLTLAEAKAHCQRKDTQGKDWFDLFRAEGEWTAEEITERAG